MDVLKSKDLLLIAPNFIDCIHDQAALIRPFLNDMHVLVPVPYFSDMALHFPYFKEHFGFLKVLNESREGIHNHAVMSPKFFTLPIEALRKRNQFLAAKSCVRALSRNMLNFNLIHAHFLESGYIGASLKNLYNKPFVVTAHGGDVYDTPFKSNWHNALARYVLKEANQVITVSHSNAKILLSLGVSSRKLHVIPNGYDEKLFKKINSYKMKKKLNLPANKRVILSVGNLFDVKGHTYLIDAMGVVLKRETDAILIIIGSGPLLGRLRKKINRLGLKGKILLAGGKPHEEVPMWMNASDIFVLPSLGEGFPTVIPEAMACGKPVIGTRVGGVPEALSNKDLGILVNSRDPVALADAILIALEKKWRTEIILDHAKQYAWANIVERILEVYQAI